MRKLSLREPGVPEEAGGRAETQTSSVWAKGRALQDVILSFLRGCVGEDDFQKTSRRVHQVKMEGWGKDGNSRWVTAEQQVQRCRVLQGRGAFRKLTNPLVWLHIGVCT